MAAGDTDKMLREMAQVRGFKLVKSRRRKPGGDFGRYGLRDARTGKDCFGFGERGLKASAEDVEAFLRGRVQSDWKSSLSAPEAALGPVARRSKGAIKAPAEPQSRRKAAAPERSTSRPVPSAGKKKNSRVSRREKPEPQTEPQPRPPPPKPGLTLRSATRKDAPAIAALIGQDASPGPRRIAATLDALAKQGKPVVVAVQGGVVGLAAYDVITTLQRAEPLGRITFLLTAEGQRRRGIGTGLLKEAEARLRKLGCGTFEMVHDIELSNANNFLRTRGYLRSGYRFAREARR